MKQARYLIIIPGIGDDNPVYHMGALIYGWFGFKTQVRVFGWNNSDPTIYKERIDALNHHIASLDGAVYLLGVSAGGSAAVNCLASQPEKISKVVTLCSPLRSFDHQVNPLLEVSIRHTEQALASMPTDTKTKILSAHALFDQVVPINLSKPQGIRTKVIPTALHVITIFLSLTILSWLIVRFLKQR